MSIVIDDERCRVSLSKISPALKNYEIVLTANERLEKYIEADIFDIKNGDYVAHFKLNNLKEDTTMKNYHVKIDAHIWLDQNFEIKANSMEEAQEKAENIQLKLLEDAPKISNGSAGNKELEQLQNYLQNWSYGDLGFDIVYVEKNQ